MRSLYALLCLCLFSPVLFAQASAPTLTLEQAMADPDWIGNAPEEPYLDLDGRYAYYLIKRDGSTLRDLWRADLRNGAARIIEDGERNQIDGADWVLDRSGKRALYTVDGDLWIRSMGKAGRQLTRTAEAERNPQWMADGRAMVLSGQNWLIVDPQSGLSYPAAELAFEKAPDASQPEGLSAEELRLIETLKFEYEQEQAQREQNQARARANPAALAPKVYLGDEHEAVASVLSPNGRWLALLVQPKGRKPGQRDKMPKYVARSGYVEIEDVRTLVGRDEQAAHSLILVDLHDGSHRPVTVDALPQIKRDPLAELRAAARVREAQAKGETLDAEKAQPKVELDQARPLQFQLLAWNHRGDRLVVRAHSNDFKDRWIASVDLDQATLAPIHHLHDPAWINWAFNDAGWMPDGEAIWFLSEHSGYSHLYLQRPGESSARALTEGQWEVQSDSVTPTHDGRWIYFAANRESPFSTEVYRVAASGGPVQRVTELGGQNTFQLSADGRRLLISHAESYLPAQLYVQSANPGTPAKALTDTRTDAYRQFQFQQPEFIWFPSSHGDFQIPAKFYPARGEGKGRGAAVIFVHGAGYTQDVHQGYPYYFREQMFHNLLTEQGVSVIVPDYRASEGYGRDWRTAIYRNMGHPELEDLLDAKAWLVANHGVDPGRVGVYGGSYGGFMTMMALFRAPTDFAAGAALRPVTDWAHYNHFYTGNILNTPQIDPEAYRVSSPIEHAAGLQRPLLIAHGMLDDNVFFKDSVRLVQRLIELRKGEYFELAAYPLERHGFVYSDSWYDEYGRIWRLFGRELGF
ncbi:MAG: S9 family peptidase [Xanthomonadales bacterium]|nr:S9 family peptidase [Xanthomonadales bacterium]